MAPLAAASPQRYAAPVDRAAYRSPDGRHELTVDPADRFGGGVGTYRLTCAEEEVWSGEHPFTLRGVAVGNDGRVAGFALTDSARELGDLVFAVLGPDGELLGEEREPRRNHPSFLRDTVGPGGRGVFLHPTLDQAFLRVADPSGSGVERWWRLRLSTGEALPPIEPNRAGGGLGGPDHARWSCAARALPGTPLVLSNWMGDGPVGVCFALLDGDGAVVWRLDLNEPYDVERQRSGAILAVGERLFTVLQWSGFVERRFAVSSDGGDWRVEEVGRAPHVDRPAPEPPRLATREIELEVLGTVRFRGEPDLPAAQDSPLRAVAATLDDLGRFHLVDSRTGALDTFDASGSRLRVVPLQGLFSGDVTVEDLAVRADGHFFLALYGYRRLAELYPDGDLVALRDLAAHEGARVFVPGSARTWVERGVGLELVDEEGATLTRIDRAPDGRWLHDIEDFDVAQDGSVALLDRPGQDPPEVHLYDEHGRPRGTWRLPERCRFARNLAYDGERLVVRTHDALFLIDPAGEDHRLAPLPGVLGYRPFLAPGGGELWLLDYDESRMTRCALP